MSCLAGARVSAGLAGALTVGGGAVLTSITGVILTEANGAYQLLGVMLFCSLMALAAAFYVLRVNRREGRERPNPSAG